MMLSAKDLPLLLSFDRTDNYSQNDIPQLFEKWDNMKQPAAILVLPVL